MSAHDQLIEIYARYRSDQVGTDQEYVDLCKAHDSDNVFHALRNRIENIKKRLEEQAGIQTSYQKQVKYCLLIFYKFLFSENDEDEICRRIVSLSYYRNWNAKQQAYFTEACSLLRTKEDYFLSFTQRNPFGAGNPINSYHRHLIQCNGLPDPKDNKENQLGYMLDRYLRSCKYQFRGFFFPVHEGDSRNATQKFLTALDNSLVFIQLVQNVMFSREYRNTNYCFMEWQRATEKRKSMVLVFADGQHPQDFIDRDNISPEFEGWHQYVHAADCIYFEETRYDHESRMQSNLDKLKRRFVEAVRKRQEAIWEGSPPDLE